MANSSRDKKMHALVAFLIIFDYIHARTEKA
jgi:hypothetical protein